jgi:hypothetical protein
MKKTFLWVRHLFITKKSQIQVGSVVKFKALLREIIGIVEEIRGKKARVFYVNYGSSKIVSWIPLSSLVIFVA